MSDQLVTNAETILLTQVIPRERKVVDVQVGGDLMQTILDIFAGESEFEEMVFFHEDPANSCFLLEIGSDEETFHLKVVRNFIEFNGNWLFYKGRNLSRLFEKVLGNPVLAEKEALLDEVLGPTMDSVQDVTKRLTER